MSNGRPPPKQHEAWLIQLLRRLFERAKFKVEDHKKVGELPLEIDMIVISAGEEAPPNFSELPLLFQYFRQHNVMELKTEKDRLEIADLLKLQAYGWLYMAKQGIFNVAEVTCTALVHHFSPTVLEALPVLGYEQIEKDIYRCDSRMLSYVIAFGDLPDESMPEELRVFSNPARRQPIIINELGRRQSSPLLEAILDLYESEVLKLMAIKQETIERFIETLGEEKVITILSKKMGREKLFANFSKEDLLAALSKEDLLAALGKEDVIAAFGEEEILRSLQAKLGLEQFRQLIDRFSSN
jgi:hypothetical protein